MARSKVETYLGFCIKSGKISLGNGAISTLKGGVYLIISDAAAAKNSQKLAVKFKNRFNCPLVVCRSGLDDAVNKPGCKVAAIRDGNLADAILNNLDDGFVLFGD